MPIYAMIGNVPVKPTETPEREWKKPELRRHRTYTKQDAKAKFKRVAKWRKKKGYAY